MVLKISHSLKQSVILLQSLPFPHYRRDIRVVMVYTVLVVRRSTFFSVSFEYNEFDKGKRQENTGKLT